MNDLKYKYYIIKGINDMEIIIIDRVRKTIYAIENGMYVNKIKEIQKVYEKDKKSGFMKGYVGSEYLRTIIDGESRHFSSSAILLKTNDRKEFDMECMEIRKEQTKLRLKRIERELEKLLKGEQYYTYVHSNSDDVIGEEKLDDKYSANNKIVENTLDEILKPKHYEEKEVEVTILDEEYDLGTTFYYIGEPKGDYEVFMKYLAENMIVKEIWKDSQTLIVGIGEFIKKHVKEFSHLFGKQMEEVHIENIIKMIDGNATESCYEDFLKEFKVNFSFMLCNNHTFEEIKKRTVEDLDYKKAHDLAFIENRETHTSAYLGVYDNQIQLTYSVHSQNNFDSIYENIASESININNIKSENDLERVMKSMLENFCHSRSEFIEELSKKLNEENTEEQEESEELDDNYE